MAEGDATSDKAALDLWIDRQYRLSAAAMLQSISAVQLVKQRPGFGQTVRAAKGSVLASTVLASYDPDPDYFFHWLRDSAIVIDAVRTLVEDGGDVGELIGRVEDFVRFSLALGELNGRELVGHGRVGGALDPKFQQYLRPDAELIQAAGENILSETRFNPDGTLDISKWPRPQNDGPALRALVVIRFWRMGVFSGADIGDAARGLVASDLAFTHRRWRDPCFDIWEEEVGHHYYTRLVQMAALADGGDWTEKIGDAVRGRAYRAASQEIANSLDRYWSADNGYYRSRLGVANGEPGKELDIATVLAVNHAGRDMGSHSALDAKVHATLSRLETLFAETYRINRSLPPALGPALGRYGGDRYYSGGPYYFATLAAAEHFFRAGRALAMGSPRDATAGDVRLATGLILDPDPFEAAEAFVKRGDSFLATVREFAPAGGELSEQFDGRTGQPASSKNLSWSHAAFIAAVAARKAARRAIEARGGREPSF